MPGAKRLPGRDYRATFTLPAARRPIAYRHPKAVYEARFTAAITTLKALG